MEPPGGYNVPTPPKGIMIEPNRRHSMPRIERGVRRDSDAGVTASGSRSVYGDTKTCVMFMDGSQKAARRAADPGPGLV